MFSRSNFSNGKVFEGVLRGFYVLELHAHPYKPSMSIFKVIGGNWGQCINKIEIVIENISGRKKIAIAMISINLASLKYLQNNLFFLISI